MIVKGRVFYEGGDWVVDADPYAMTMFKRSFPRATPKTTHKAKCQHTKVPVAVKATVDNGRDILWFLERFTLDVEPADRKRLVAARKQYDANEHKIREALAGRLPIEPVRLALELRHYQQEAVKLVAAVQRLVIGDDIGLGKTAEGIGVTALPGALPAVIVCPTYLCTQWICEIERFMPEARVMELKTLQAEDIDRTLTHVVTAPNRLAAWAPKILEWGPRTVIFDEGHEYRRPGTQKGDAAVRLSEAARYVVLMSATPIFNYGEEAHTIWSLVKPDCLGDRGEFEREWGRVVRDPVGLGMLLRNNGLFLRRTRADVGRELPPVNRVVLSVDADLAALQDLEDLAVQLAQRSLTGGFEEAGQASREFDARLRQATGVAKAGAVCEVVRGYLSSEPRVVIFGWHHAVYDHFRSALKEFNPVFFTGSEGPGQKDQALKDFMEGRSRVFVMSLRAGQGLDGLQKVCSTGVVAELDWSPQVHDQCVGRLARDGQEGRVTMVYVTVQDGADPPMMEVLGLKRDQAGGIVDLRDGDTPAEVPQGRLLAMAEDYLVRRGLGMFAARRRPAPALATAVTECVARLRLPWREKAMQDLLEGPLSDVAAERGLVLGREVVLSPESRIDFQIGRVGIECKVDGDRMQVYRQVKRYLEHDALEALVLVCPWPIPDFVIGDKPVIVACTTQAVL